MWSVLCLPFPVRIVYTVLTCIAFKSTIGNMHFSTYLHIIGNSNNGLLKNAYKWHWGPKFELRTQGKEFSFHKNWSFFPSSCKLGWRRSCALDESPVHQGVTQGGKQPFALTFTPAVDSLLMCMSAGGKQRREPTRTTCSVPSLFSLHLFIRSCFCSVFSGCVSISHISIGS